MNDLIEAEVVGNELVHRQASRESQLEGENIMLRCLLSCVLTGRYAKHRQGSGVYVIDQHIVCVIPAIVERNPTGCYNIFPERIAIPPTNLLPAAEPQPVPPEQQQKTQS